MAVNPICLGERLKYYRRKSKISQEKLAEMVDVSREYIAFIEAGTRTPSVDILTDLANALNISADDLLADSLDCLSRRSDTAVYRLILDCNETEEKIIIRIIKNLKEVLFQYGV